MSTMDPAGDGGGGGDSGADKNITVSTPSTHHQHPPPSPLSGCYLLVVLPEPHTAQHKDLILSRLAKGFLSWDKDNCHVDLEKELQALIAQAPEGEEARNGERLIQYATENLVTEVLIHPQTNTLLQCIRNLLASFTRHRHIIHAGYTYGGNGSWILQDGTFSYADFVDVFSEHEVQRVLHAYENSVTVDIHCAGVSEWSTSRLCKEPCTRSCQVKVNPDDVLTAGVPAITSFTHYIEQYLVPQTLDQLMEPSDVVGNIRFSHPTLYVFPGGQGDAALFGINGFNMLVDGGFARKACFWDFARHLDRLDAVLVTRINNSNISGMSSVLRKKKEMHVYPQIGHFFCNLVERRHSNSPDGDKDIDPLILDLIDMGQEMMVNLRHISLRSHHCYRDPDPINLYHKVGHGTLDMFVLSPSKDSKEVREFLAKWHASDSKLFSGSHKKDSNNLVFPIQNVVSICALLVWQPANPEGTITRILFPGSTPQHKIFEGLDRLKHLEFLKHPTCSAKSLSPSTSLVALKDKPLKKMGLIEREVKKTELKKEKKETPEIKVVKGSDESPPKSISQTITGGRTAKVEVKTRKVAENKKIESEAKESKKIEDMKEIKKRESARIEKSEKQDGEMKKTDVIKAETERTAVTKEHKAKPEPKKREIRDIKTTVKNSKPEAPSKPSPKPIEKKVLKPSADKKDVKSSPTTPKKTLNGTASKTEMSKTVPKVQTKPATRAPSSAPAKSAKDANNRKVVEQKNIEMSSMAGTAAATATSKAAKQKPVERKPISRRTKPVSPSKPRVPSSPAKSTRSTPTTSVKSDKDGVIRKVKGDRGTTDSSTVSTPSGIEPDSVVRLVEKSLTEKSEDMSLDSIESKVLADLKEEREVVEEIEAVLQKAERIEEARKEERFEGDDEITAEATDKKEEDMTEEDVTAEIEDAPKKESSRKASQEFTEEDEYLIVEKEEIYTEDSVLSGEGEQKHFLEEVESEKAKILKDKELPKEEEAEEKKDEVPEKKLDFAETSGIQVQERRPSELLSPENKEQLKEEMKEIIATAAEAVQKTEEKDDSGKKDSEDITKEPWSLSPDKVVSSEKKTTDTDQKTEVDQKEPVPEKMEESQERISTLESGATTTAPTLPEDERITLDEIKEVIDEKHVAEEVKENVVSPVNKEVIPAEIPAPVIRQSIPAHHRDSVKTPDEVADLPVHEEVDPKLYRMDDFSKNKDEKVQSPQDSKKPPTPPVKEQKGMFSFFGKVADKFEKGYDKLTKKKKDSDKDTDDKSSSKSSSPKDPKPKEPAFEDVDMEKVFQKVSTVSDKPDTFEQVEPKLHDVKVATIKETATFLQEEIKDVGRTSILDSESKAECTIVDVVEAEKISEQLKLDEKPSPPKDFKDLKDEVLTEGETKVDAIKEALIQESSDKSKSAKDSLRDSLESLEETGPREHEINLADLPPPTDIIADTLTGVAEKLGEIKPPVAAVSPVSKEPEKVKFTAPESEELDAAEDKEEDDLGHIPDLKEAVRDIGEVLAGTAGIELEEKPKDVIEIVKKVAEVLKEDDFLSEKALFEIAEKKERPTVLDSRPSTADDKKSEVEDEAGKSRFGDIIPKKVGVTEQLPSQEEVEEMLQDEIVKPLPAYQRANEVEVQEQPCIKVVKDTQFTSPANNEATGRQRILEMGADLLGDINICEQTGVCDDSKVDVLEAGLEQVCTKTILQPRFDEADDTNEEIESSDIGFEQKLSPAKAELVVVTPGSTPTSPKFAADKISEHDVQVVSRLADQLPADIRHVLEKGGNVEDIIEEIVMSKKQKITTEIIEYIIIIKRVSRERVIEIIETIIIKRGISRESAMEGEDIAKTEVVISPQKRNDVEDYIEKEYVNRERRITKLIIEEISLLKIIPEDVLMEIIENIIIKRKITRDSVLDILDDKTQEISLDVKDDSKKEAPAVSEGAVDDQKLMSMTKVTEKKEISVAESAVNLEEDLIEGFVNIPSAGDVAAFISEERRTTYDELEFEVKDSSSGKTLPGKDYFESVEEEYKVCGLTQSPDVSGKLSEAEDGTEDTSDVIEADEKFVKETKGKLGKEKESVLDDIKKKKEEMDSRVQDSEISETSEVIDATEKYLDEAKEKVVAPVKETDEKKSPELEKAFRETKVADTTVPLIEERKKSISDKVSGEVLSETLQEKIDDQEVQDITVRKMLVTASSEDGGHETEICAAGTITFTKSVSPDSLKESSLKSTPDKDSLVMDKDSLHSDEKSPEMDSISDKSGPEAKGKVSPVDSLDKSPVGTRESQDLEDSLEKKVEVSDKKSTFETAPEKTLDYLLEKSHEKQENANKLMDLGELKSPELGHSGDVSPAESVFAKSPTEKPEISAGTSISEKSLEIEIKSFEEISKPTSVPENLTDISSSTISEKYVTKTSMISDEVVELQNKVDKVEEKESPEKPVSKSRSSSIVSEKGDLPSVQKLDDINSKESNLAAEEVDKSIATSIGSEKPEEKEAKSRTASISEGKPDDKSTNEQILEKSRSASIVGAEENENPLDKSRSTSIISVKADEKGSTITSEKPDLKENDLPKSPSIVDGKPDEKDFIDEAAVRSRSASIASEKVEAKKDKEHSDQSKSPSIAGDKPGETDLIEEIVSTSKSSSISGEKVNLKEDPPKSPSITGEKHGDKHSIAEATIRSRSSSIASEKAYPVKDLYQDKEPSGQPKSPSIASDKPCDKDLIDEASFRSRSSSIASEKAHPVKDSYHDKEPSDKPKSPGIAGDKPGEKQLVDEASIRSRSSSITSEKPHPEEDSHHDKEPSDQLISPSIAGDKPGDEDLFNEATTKSRSSSIANEKAHPVKDSYHDIEPSAHPKSPNIAGDKPCDKELIDKVTIRSRSSSMASEKAHPVKDSYLDKEPSAQPKSPTIVDDKHGDKEMIDEASFRSRSSSIASEKAHPVKDSYHDKEPSDEPKSPGIAGDKPGDKQLIDEAAIRSRSSSIVSEKAHSAKDSYHDKEPSDQLKSPGIAGDKPDDKNVMDEAIIRSRSSSMVSEKAHPVEDSYLDKEPSAQPKSPTIVVDKHGDKELIDEASFRSRSSSIVSEKAHPVEDSYQDKEPSDEPKSPAIAGDKTGDKQLIDEATIRSRSSSIVSEKAHSAKDSYHDKEPSDQLKSPSIAGDKPDDKNIMDEAIIRSRSSSMASEKAHPVKDSYLDEEASAQSKSPTTVDDKPDGEQLIDEATLRSRSSSIASEKAHPVNDSYHDKEPSDKPKSPGIAGDKPGDKPGDKQLIDEATIRSRSSSIVSEKAHSVKDSHHDKGPSDQLKSPNIAGDKPDDKNIIDEATIRSSSIASEKAYPEKDLHDDKEPSDQPKSPSIAGDKPGDKQLIDEAAIRSRSSSISSEKAHAVKDSYLNKEPSDQLKSPSIAGDKPGDKELIDGATIRSRSSSIASEKAHLVKDSYHDKDPSDKLKSPSIAGEKPDNRNLIDEVTIRSRSSSIVSEKAHPEEDSHKDKEPSEQPKSPSIAGDKPDVKNLIDEATTRSRSSSVVIEKAHPKQDSHKDKESSDQPKSPSIADDKPGDKELIDEATMRSRSSSIVSEKAHPVEDSFHDIEPSAQQKSPSIAGDKPCDKELIDKATIRSRSSSIVSEKAHPKEDSHKDKEPSDQPKSPSIAGDKPDVKNLIDEATTRSRSSSVVIEKAHPKQDSHKDKESSDQPKSPSIADDKPGDKELIDEATIRSRSSSIVSEKAHPVEDSFHDIEPSAQQKSPSIAGDKPCDKELIDKATIRSRSSSIVSEKAHPKEDSHKDKEPSDQPKSPSIAGDKPDVKNLIDEATTRSRSSSIVVEKAHLKEDSHKDKEPSDQLKSPSIAGDKPDDKNVIDEATIRSRSSSIVSEKAHPVKDSYHDKELSDQSKSPSIAGDKADDENLIDEATIRSRSSSIVSEKAHPVKDSFHDIEPSAQQKSPSIAGDKPCDKELIDKATIRSRSSSNASEKAHPVTGSYHDKEPSDQLKSPSIAGEKLGDKELIDEATIRSRSSSIVSEKAYLEKDFDDDKEPSDQPKSPSIAGDKPDGKQLIDEATLRSRSSSIASGKAHPVNDSHHDKEPSDELKSPSITGDKHGDKELIGEATIISRSSSIASEKAHPVKNSYHDMEPSDQLKSPSIAGDKLDDEDSINEATNKSRSSSIVSEKAHPVKDSYHDIEPSSQSKSPSIADDKPCDKELIDEATIRSRSSSIANEKAHPVKDSYLGKEPSAEPKSPTIVDDKHGDKELIDEASFRSRSSSIASEKAHPEKDSHHDKGPSDQSKSPSIAGDKPGDKQLIDAVTVRSRSASIVSEKSDTKKSSDVEDLKEHDHSKSPCVAGDKPGHKDLIDEATDRSRSSSIPSEGQDIKEPSDKVKAAALTDKSDEKEAYFRSKSPSIAGDKFIEKDVFEDVISRSRSSSVASEKPDTDKIKSATADISDKLSDKESVDRTRSPSIAGDKIGIKDLEDATDKSRLTGVASLKMDEKEIFDKMKSATAEKSDEKEAIYRSKSPSIAGDLVEEAITISRTSSISSEKSEIKSTHHSKSPTIAGDKLSEKHFMDDATIKSRSSSIVSDKQDLKESVDPIQVITTGVQPDEKKPTDRSKSPSIAGDNEIEIDLVEVSKSRSSSNLSEKLTPEPLRKPSFMGESKHDDKSEKEYVEHPRSASLISDKLDEDSIDRTKSPSSISEKSDEKDECDRSKSPSVDGYKFDQEGDQALTKSISPSMIVEKLEHDLTKEELKVEDQDRSRTSSVSSTKAEEKITLKDSDKEEIRSRSSSIVSDKPDEKISRSRASSIASEKGDRKEVLDKSRSPSVAHETEKVQKSDVQVPKSSKAESPTEDRTPKDRSRSHSLFEGGEKTPLGRSRAASVFEDKPSEKINLLDQVKGALEAPLKTSILEEKVEMKSSLEKLTDSRKGSLAVTEISVDVSEKVASRKQSEADIYLSRRSSEEKLQIVPDVKDALHLNPEERVEIESYVLNECVGKKKKVSAQMLDEMSATRSVSRSVIIFVIEEILLKLNIPRDTIIGFDQEEQEISHSEEEDELEKLSAEKLANIEKYISEEYIEKHKKLSLKAADEIANLKLVSRSIIIAIVEEIVLVKKLTRQSIFESDILELGKSSIKEIDTITESQPTDTKSSGSKDAIVVPDLKGSSLTSIKDQDITTHDIKRENIDSKSSIVEQDFQSLKPVSKSPSSSPEPEVSVSRVSFQQSTDLLETQIPEEISISEEKRTEVKTLLLEDYINKGKKITETSLQEVINKTGVPRYIILEIIDEFIYIKKLSRDNVIDKLLFLEEEPEDSFERSLLSTPDIKSSGYSTPEIKHFDEKLAKSIPYVADYESPFHKAFVGGMTEMRTTHITTLSGKSTPDLGGRADTPESDVTSTTGTTSQEVTEKKQESKAADHQEMSSTEKTVDKDLGAESEEDLSAVKTTVLKTTHLVSHFDQAESLDDLPKDVKREVIVYEEEPEILETVTTKTTTTVLIDEGSGDKATTSEIEKPELYTYIISREGQAEVTESSKSTSQFVTKVISRESTPEITSDVKRIVTTVTTVTDSNGKVTTMKDVTESNDTLEREELLDKLIDSSQGEKSLKVSEMKTEVSKSDKVMKETATTLTSTSGVSTPDVKFFYDSGKSTPDPKLEEKLEVLDKISAERLEHSLSPLIRDIVSDDKSLSGKSSPDISLPKDIAYSGSTGKSTPDIPVSPLNRDGAPAHHHPSGRSTPDKRLEGRSRTSTPEGFRSGEVLRTIITTTRTMSDDGDIITTTKEVTEATNEKGETVVITEKTDVKVDDHVPVSTGSTIGGPKSADLQRVPSPGSDIMSERDAGPISPRSDLSSGHSRAATHIWGSSEERHTYSDDEPPSSPLSTTSHFGHSPRHFEHESMISSFYGDLPTAVTKTETGVRFSDPLPSQSDTPTKILTVEKEFASGFSHKADSKKYIDEADLDSDKVLLEVKDTKESSSTSTASEDKTKDDKSEPMKDPIEGWGTPLGLPSPKRPRKFNLRSPCQPSSSSCDLSPDSLNFDVVSDWGEPLRLPSPAPVPNEVSNKGSPGTPKKERKQTKKVISENIKNKKRSESPSKNEKKLKDSKNKIQPVYMDLTYVPHHGNSYYTSLDFFKRIRARYYVFSGTEPSREVYDALLEAKKTWEDKDLEVTMIPTYDTDTLGYWVADNEEALAAHHIDLSPSASRCTINLQDHETSCSAYRLEF